VSTNRKSQFGQGTFNGYGVSPLSVPMEHKCLAPRSLVIVVQTTSCLLPHKWYRSLR
jgi:hypothetical protein